MNEIMLIAGIFLGVGWGIYDARKSIFKRCSICEKWAWQTTRIFEYTTGAECETCRDKRFKELKELRYR